MNARDNEFPLGYTIVTPDLVAELCHHPELLMWDCRFGMPNDALRAWFQPIGDET